VPEKRTDGRIISQALSTKLILGVGIVLLIGAILPFLFGKASRRDSAVTELPAWTTHGGPTAAANTAQSEAPAWSAPATAGAPPQSPPGMPPAILSPQPPQVGDTRPPALTDPAWSQPRSAATPWPAPNNYANPPVANTNPPDNRGFDRPVDPRNLQADNRNDAVARFGNDDPRYDYRGNPPETTPVRRDPPPSGYPRDPRYDNASSNYSPATGQGSPLMPSGTPAPTATYRDPQISEPGVARFDGTIANPPVRTGYDRAGPGN
jgi:hypothetical protein